MVIYDFYFVLEGKLRLLLCFGGLTVFFLCFGGLTEVCVMFWRVNWGFCYVLQG